MGGLNESGTVFEIEDQDIVSPQIMSWLLIRKSGDSSGPPFDKDGRPCPVSGGAAGIVVIEF
jgi:hypothetical protein